MAVNSQFEIFQFGAILKNFKLTVSLDNPINFMYIISVKAQ